MRLSDSISLPEMQTFSINFILKNATNTTEDDCTMTTFDLKIQRKKNEVFVDGIEWQHSLD
jgi:hypothetical protein